MVVDADAGKCDESYFVDGPIPAHLVPGLTRDFTDEERVAIRHNVHLSCAPPEQKTPRCLWVCGPPAVGKSTVTATKSHDLFGSEDNAVVVDGEILRLCHGGWREVVADGFHRLPLPLIHRDAWNTLKNSKVLDVEKNAILKEAISQRQHLCIPEAMANFDKVLKNVKVLEDAGYEQHLVCLWAPRHVIRLRGEARQVKEGKTFSMKTYLTSVRGCCKIADHFVQNYPPRYCSILTTDRVPNLCLTIHELQAHVHVAEEHEEPEAGDGGDSGKLQSLMRFKHAGARVMLASALCHSKSKPSALAPSPKLIERCKSDDFERARATHFKSTGSASDEPGQLKHRIVELEAQISRLQRIAAASIAVAAISCTVVVMRSRKM